MPFTACVCGFVYCNHIESRALSVCVCVFQEEQDVEGSRAMRAGSHRVWNTHHVSDKDHISYVRADKKNNPLFCPRTHSQSHLSARERGCVSVSIYAADKADVKKEE